MKISITHYFMVRRSMVFGKIITMVVDTFVPEDVKVFLCLAIAEPVQPHVPSFGPSLFHVGMNKGVCG